MRNVVRGRVVDANGRAFSGIRVVAQFDQHHSGASGEGAATTVDDGRYEIRGLRNEGFNVVALGPKPHLLDAPPQHVDLSHAVAADGVDFAVVPGPRVHLRVRDIETGEPVAGVDIIGRRPGLETLPRLATTDANGGATFSVGLLRSELGVVETRESGPLSPIMGDFFAHSAEASKPETLEWTKWTFRPKPPGSKATFHLEAVDGSGKPVAGATVTMRRFGENRVYRTVTDANGRAAVEAWRLQTSEPEGAPVLWLVEKGALAGEAMPDVTEVWHPTRVTLALSHTATLRGRIVDEHGAPLPRARVFTYEYFAGSSTQGDRRDDLLADDEGRFEIPRLWTKGLYYFSFGSSYRDGKLGGVAIPRRDTKPWYVMFGPGETRDMGTVVVPHADHTITGVLVDEDGKSVNHDVDLELKGEHTSISTSTDAQGRFRFEGVVDEPLTLRVMLGSYNVYRSEANRPNLLLERAVTVADGDLRLQVTVRPPLHPAQTIPVPRGH